MDARHDTRHAPRESAAHVLQRARSLVAAFVPVLEVAVRRAGELDLVQVTVPYALTPEEARVLPLAVEGVPLVIRVVGRSLPSSPAD